MSESQSYKTDGFDAFVSMVMLFVALPLRAWTIGILWRWFAVPVGAPALTFGALMGLSILWSYLNASLNAAPRHYKDASEWYFYTVAGPFIVSGMTLFIAVIVRGIFG